jgi:RNA polymerase sigma-70 factor (ECF subfamily)
MLPHASDAELVSLSLKGSEAAFATLAGRYKNWLFRFIRCYFREESVAQDILQETFISAWRALETCDTARPLSAWLRQIALNKCRDRARHQAVWRFLIPWSGAYELTVPDATKAADEGMVESETMVRLRTAIDSLPLKLKSALILTALEELSHAEAAAIMKTTPKSIEGLVYRARKRLATALEKDPVQPRRSVLPRRPADSVVW